MLQDNRISSTYNVSFEDMLYKLEGFMKKLTYNWKLTRPQVLKLGFFLLWIFLYLLSDYLVLDFITFDSSVTHELKLRYGDGIRAFLNTLIGIIALYYTFADRKAFFRKRISENLGLEGMDTLFMPLALSLVPLVAAANDLGKALNEPLFMLGSIPVLLLAIFGVEMYWLFRFERKENDVDSVVSVHVVGLTILCFIVAIGVLFIRL
ncbi:hypothetical protein ABEH32_22105 [Pantoea agglomerans]|uniref:hypothetical protein n=1 Tax=Enterobacter agglomerans TaxID=549 RepID=UPI001654AC8C|nr:hypothetical protein [Pantoea agglomerans]